MRNVVALRGDFRELDYVMFGLRIKNLKNVAPNPIDHEAPKHVDSPTSPVESRKDSRI